MMHPAFVQTLAAGRAEELRRTARREDGTWLVGARRDRASDEVGQKHRIRRPWTLPLRPRETSPFTTRQQAPHV
jgi:hypothetical protein